MIDSIYLAGSNGLELGVPSMLGWSGAEEKETTLPSPVSNPPSSEPDLLIPSAPDQHVKLGIILGCCWISANWKLRIISHIYNSSPGDYISRI